MGQLMSFLDALPVVGLIFQLAGYLVANIQFVAHGAIAVAIPIALAGLCGVMCERTGVINICIEGVMLLGAFVGWIVGVVATAILGPGTPLPLFGITLPLLIALASALL